MWWQDRAIDPRWTSEIPQLVTLQSEMTEIFDEMNLYIMYFDYLIMRRISIIRCFSLRWSVFRLFKYMVNKSQFASCWEIGRITATHKRGSVKLQKRYSHWTWYLMIGVPIRAQDTPLTGIIVAWCQIWTTFRSLCAVLHAPRRYLDRERSQLWLWHDQKLPVQSSHPAVQQSCVETTGK